MRVYEVEEPYYCYDCERIVEVEYHYEESEGYGEYICCECKGDYVTEAGTCEICGEPIDPDTRLCEICEDKISVEYDKLVHFIYGMNDKLKGNAVQEIIDYYIERRTGDEV